MENLNKTNDWFAARLLNDDKDPAALLVEGINPTNASLQVADFYKNKPKVQEAFKKEDGSFDNDLFNKFYEQVSKEYEYLSAVDSENFIYDAYEKSNSDFITEFGRIKDKKTQAALIANPLDQSRGLTSFNEWSEPEISQREAAQMNQYYDPETGKWSDKTLNELGAFGLLGEEGLVYATWDDDGEHIDPMTKQKVLHKKGEWKTDEFGNFYAEKAGNRENLNKQFVTWSEVLTEDGSAWNKIDIFDSDDLNQNVPKAVFRAAATVGALMIPYVGAGIGYTTAAISLARVLPQITKTFVSLFSEDTEFDQLNRWDNYMRKFRRSTSDYSQEHTFSLENIIDMATDSFMQLRQQKWIAELPERLGIMKPVKDALIKSDAVNSLKLLGTKDASLLKNNELRAALAKASPIYRNMSSYEKMAKNVSVAVSRGYLIATSTEDTYNMARSYGFDPQTSSMIALGTYVGIGTLFQTDYFRGILSNTPDYELRRDVKTLVKSYLENNAKTMAGDLAKNTTNEAKANLFKSWGNKIVKFLNDHVSEVKSGRFGIVQGAISEAIEEVSEEVMQDTAFQIGKGWNSLKSLFTGKDYTDEYSYLATDPLSRYATAFFGGALGGAIFKMSDRYLLDKAAYANWRSMLGNNSELSKQFVTLISQGKKDLILDEISRLEKTPMISTELSAFNSSVVAENPMESQNSVLFGSFRKAVNDLDTFLSNNNLKIDYDQFGDIELLKGIRAAWINSKGLSDSLFQDYLSRTNEISGIFAELQELRSQKIPNMEATAEADLDKKINQLQEIIDLKINQVRNLVQGKDDSYIGRLMLETNKDILNAITPTTKNALAENLYGRSYDQLPLSLQARIDEKINAQSESGQLEINYMAAWDLYKKLSSSPSVISSLDSLNSVTKNFSEDLLGVTIVNGELIPKQYDKDSMTPESIFEDVKRVVRTVMNQSSLISDDEVAHVAYRLLGLKGILPDINPDEATIPFISMENGSETSYNIANLLEAFGEEEVNKLYNTYTNLYNSFVKDLEENKDDPKKVFDKYQKARKADPGKITADLIYARFADIEAIEKARELALNAIRNINDLKNATTDLTFENTVDESQVAKLVDLISDLVSSNSVKLLEFINREQKRVATLGNQYALDSNLQEVIKNLKGIISLAEAILSGADVNYRTLLSGVPFGANNFLNQAFAEKGLNIKLAETSSETIAYIKHVLYGYNIILDSFVDKDRKNRGEVINQEKKLSLRVMQGKLGFIPKLKQFVDTPEFIKDGFLSTLNSDFDFINVDKITSDEDFINLGVQYRNQLLEFENKFHDFYHSLNSEGKVQLIQWLVNNLSNKELVSDTSVVSTNNKILFDDQDFYQYLMSISFGNITEITNSYREFVKENSKMCPFDSQEEVAISIARFLLRNNKEEVKLWTDPAIARFKSVHSREVMDPLNYAIKAICSGGTGKTSAIIPIVYSIVRDLNPDKNIIFATNNDKQANNLKSGINNNDENYLLISTLLEDSKNEDTFKEKYQDSIIIVDEATNISTESLKVLDLLCEKYNISIAYLGDVKQHGALHNFDYEVFLPTTLQLAESKRALNDITRENNDIWEELFKPNEGNTQELQTSKLAPFKYYEDINVLEGIKFEDALLSQEYIESFIATHNIPDTATILIFSDNILELSKNNFLAKHPNITFANTISDIQGIEWDYVISDRDNFVEDHSEDNGVDKDLEITKTLAQLKDIYTLFTRHKHAIVSLKPIQAVNLRGRGEEWLVKEGINNVQSQFKPIVSGLTPEAIDKFKEYKLKILEKLNLPETVEKPVEDKKEVPITQSSKIEVNSSVAQVTPGFLLKEEFTPEYISKLNVSSEEYYKARVILYKALTGQNRDIELSKLPESLKNGEFRLKVQYSVTDDLYNLGNKYRDEKFLNGNHAWIVYHTEFGDITLGMFHNPETASTGGLSESNAANIIGELSKSGANSEPKYYKIDFDKLHFSRSMNPIAIQNRETNDSDYVNIVYENGSFNISGTDAYKFANTTAAFYFRKGNESIVPVQKILEELEKLRQNYESFYNLAVKNGVLYKDPSEYNDILELLDLDRSTIKGEPKWHARRVVDLEGRFCSFISLNEEANSKSITGDLKSKSNIYLQQLVDRNKQITELLTILSDSTLDDAGKKGKIKEVLSNKPQWSVSILTYDYDAIETEEDFRNAILGLQTNEVLATGRNRAAYNNALNHQFETLLSRIANILLNNTSKWPSSGPRLNKTDVENIRNHWNKYKESLIQAYSVWSGRQETEESLLNFLSNALLYNPENNQKVTEYFIANDNNLMQSSEFMEYLKDIYITDSLNVNWASVINKTNGLKYISKEFALKYAGHAFPKLIKDNALSIHTKGDALSIHKGANFKLKSKVVQLAQIHVNIDDGVTVNDFERVSEQVSPLEDGSKPNQNPVVEKESKKVEEAQKVEEKKEEPITIKSLKKLNRSNSETEGMPVIGKFNRLESIINGLIDNNSEITNEVLNQLQEVLQGKRTQLSIEGAQGTDLTAVNLINSNLKQNLEIKC